MKKYIAKMDKAHANLQGTIGALESEIEKMVEFEDYSIFWQPNDGWVLQHEMYNAPPL